MIERYKFNLAQYTTYGLGGLCKVAYFPETDKEAENLFSSLTECKEKFFILGRGSNILASDNYFNGSIICTTQLKGISRVDKDKITCKSGTTVAQLLKYCRKNGLSGLEFLAGIPASIGGLILMNAGAGGNYISERLLSCTVYDSNLRNFSNKSCNFGNKYSTMRDINCIILDGTFEIAQTSESEVKRNINKFLLKRRSQPKGKSCGCVFKNPSGLSAGKLIDECGLKGTSLGGARVSSEHANFIINDGATATEVYSLIKFVKDKVFEITGVNLAEEVVYIGEFNDTFG